MCDQSLGAVDEVGLVLGADHVGLPVGERGDEAPVALDRRLAPGRIGRIELHRRVPGGAEQEPRQLARVGEMVDDPVEGELEILDAVGLAVLDGPPQLLIDRGQLLDDLRGDGPRRADREFLGDLACSQKRS